MSHYLLLVDLNIDKFYTFCMKNVIKNTTLAYAAGYIDGDGCFSIRGEPYKNRTSSKYPAALIIASVNPEVLYWLSSMLGGSIQHKKNSTPTRKSVYYFHLKKKEAIPFVQDIIPYLVEKIEEAKTFVEFAESKSMKDRNDLIEKMKRLKNSTNLVSANLKPEFEATRNTINPSEYDFAYLAGFIDAECNLGIQKYKPKDRPNYVYKIMLQCNNTKAPVFKWILERFGGQIHFIERATKESSRRNQFTWRLTGLALSNILSKIHPFLRHKQPVCAELMKFYETTLANGGARHTKSFRDKYAATLAIREEIVSKIHKLNLKGI